MYRAFERRDREDRLTYRHHQIARAVQYSALQLSAEQSVACRVDSVHEVIRCTTPSCCWICGSAVVATVSTRSESPALPCPYCGYSHHITSHHCIEHSRVHYSTVQYSTVQRSTVQLR